MTLNKKQALTLLITLLALMTMACLCSGGDPRIACHDYCDRQRHHAVPKRRRGRYPDIRNQPYHLEGNNRERQRPERQPA